MPVSFDRLLTEPPRGHAGEDPYVISQRLGHASIRTTYDIYGHLFEGRDQEAADAVSYPVRTAGPEPLRLRFNARKRSTWAAKPGPCCATCWAKRSAANR